MRDVRSDIRRLVQDLLQDAGHFEPLADSDSLFLSGRLDSMSALRLLLRLEADHGLDLADRVQSLVDIDSLDRIVALVSRDA